MNETGDLERILNGLYEPVLLLDPKRRITFMNATACDLFGADLTGRDVTRVLRHPGVLAALDRVAEGERRAVDEVVLNLPSPSLFGITIKAIESGFAISMHDIGQEKRAEAMRSDFVANVSHELRSPLTAVTGFIETLRGPARDDAAARDRFLEIMARESGRMDRLISDLLSLGRVEANERLRPTAPVDLAVVLSRVISLLHTGVGLEMDAASTVVPGDEDQLEQVFANLVENAVKYSTDDGSVSLRVRNIDKVPGIVGPVVSVDVTDRGEGIAAEHIPRLTERFYRVDTGRSRDRGGTGLGLAIVKHIVARHRGRLAITSVPGTGSTFTVNLPQR